MASYADNSTQLWWNYCYSFEHFNKVVIENGITNIGDNTLKFIKSDAFELPNSVKTIGRRAFVGVGMSTNERHPEVLLSIPDSVTEIGDEAFDGASGGYPRGTAQYDYLKIELSDSIVKLGDYAFRGRIAYKNPKLPSSLRSIGKGCFEYCDGLSSIEIPDSVTYLGEDAFYSCHYLRKVTIGTNIVEAGSTPFGYSPVKVVRFTFTEDGEKAIIENLFRSETYYGGYTRDETPYLQHIEQVYIPEGIKRIGDGAFSKTLYARKITIPNSIEYIGSYAFYYSALEEIELPNSVSEIGIEAFAYNNNLKSLTVGADVFKNPHRYFDYTDHNEYIFRHSPIKTLTIKDGFINHTVRDFDDFLTVDDGLSSYDWYNEIETVIISPGITEVCSHSFYRSCMYEESYYGFKNIKQIYLPNTLNNISVESIIDASDNKVDVYYDGSKSQWNNLIFSDGEYLGSSLYNVNMHFSEKDIESISGIIRQGDGWSMKWKCSYYVDSSSNKSDPWLEIYMDGIDLDDDWKYSVPDTSSDNSPWLTATGFDKSEFTKMKILGSSQNPIYISPGLFYGYTGIKTLNLSNIYGIGGSAFENCTALQKIDQFDSKLYTIDTAAFRNDKNLSIVYSSANVNKLHTIGEDAFKGTQLKFITLMRSVENIGIDSFSGCSDLVISCYSDSSSYQYAMDHNIKVYLMDAPIKIKSDYWDNRDFQFKKGENIENIIGEYNSAVYNERLAHALSVMSRAAYTQGLVYQNYINMGFNPDNIETQHYDSYGTDKSALAPYVIGEKTIENDKKLIMITIRGTKLENLEQVLGDINFGSNMSFVNNGWHAFFSDCSEDIYECLKSLHEGQIPTDNVTYVITGHSLGAAVGNLLSMRLFNTGISPDLVYNYNFACPNVAIGKGVTSNWNNNGNHSNIINICNDNDRVPSLPGTLSEKLAFENIITLGMANSKWGKYGVTYWFDGPNDHNMEPYIDFVKDAKDTSYFSHTENKVKVIGCFCPVDVVINDSKGTPIIGTISDEPMYYGYEKGEKAFVLINGDRKVFYLYDDQNEYDVKLVGTDKGTMDLHIAKSDLISGDIYSTKEFEFVELDGGKAMIGDVKKGDSVENTKLFVVDDTDEMISEINELGDEKDIYYTVSFDTCGRGYNTVYTSKVKAGSVTYDLFGGSRPEYDGYVFDGWYKDIKYTEAWDFENKIYSNIVLYAKWIEKETNPDPVSPINPNKPADPVSDYEGIENGDLPNGKTAPEGIWVGGLKKSYPYTGNVIKPVVRVYKGNTRLTVNTDYTLSYKNNKNVGTNATITVKLKGSFKGSKDVTFAIEKNPLTSVSFNEDNLTVAYKKNKKHNNIKPVLTMDGTALKYSNKDFEFKYLDAKTGQESTCIDVGDYIIRMTTKSTSKSYTGSIDVPFKVSDKPTMGDVKITGTKVTYNGKQQIPTFTLKYKGQPVNSSAYTMLTVSGDTYIEPGSHYVIFKGNGTDFIGSRKITYKITGKKSLADSNATAILSPSSLDDVGKVPFAYGGAKPKLVISYNGVRLKENRDYTLSYKNHKKAGNTATVTAKGKGSYKGSKPVTFTVSQRDLSTLLLTINDRVESNRNNDFKKAPILFTDMNYTDQKLKVNTDYTATYTVSSGSTKPAAGDSVTVKIEAKSGGNYKGTATATYNIIEKSKDISKAKVVINSGKAYAYTGSAITPSGNDIRVTLNNSPVSASDYEITAYYNNVKCSKKAVVIINGKGNLKGSKAVNFTISSSPIDKIWDGPVVFNLLRNLNKGNTQK